MSPTLRRRAPLRANGQGSPELEPGAYDETGEMDAVAPVSDVSPSMANGNGDRSGEPLLQCRGVDMAYGPVQILFRVDFDVVEGEIVALLGTNGAGKSTLLKGICGLVKPKHGSVVFDGEDVTHLPADLTTRKGVSLMPGGKGVFPTLSVVENLRLASWLIRDRPADVEAARNEV